MSFFLPFSVLAMSARPVASFGHWNYLALTGYLAAMVMLGFWFSRRNKTTNDFFRGGQRIPWWAAGLSIYATMLSSITYMAVPAKVFATDWAYIFNSLAVLLTAPIVIVFYLPFYRRLDITSAYEYLEKRFNLLVRWFGSASFIVLQLGRGAIVLFLPALALSTVSSLDIYVCILLMSVLCILYTVLGGMEAVVWTDVAQSVVLLAGAILALVFIVLRIDGGLAEVFRLAHAHGKFLENVRWTWDSTAPTAWVVLVGGMAMNLASYTSSQDVVQRYVTTKNSRDAARSIWTNGLLAVPSGMLFFAVGTALFVFYQTHPRRFDSPLPTDAVFPLFIVEELPAGVAGLVIAGIFAAAQSTLASSLNSIATCCVTDFYRRLRPAASDRFCLRLARGVTVAAGVAVTGVACVMASANIYSLWDSFLTVLGLTTGALAGLFALGIFTTRANGPGAVCGALVSVAALCCIQQCTNVHLFLYAGIGLLVCFGVGWLASWCFGGKPSNLAGLTRATQNAP
jgi:solute:Na+ symporter, SSS family